MEANKTRYPKRGSFFGPVRRTPVLRFVDENWKPIEGINVFVYPSDGAGAELFELTSGADGRVEFWNVYGGDLKTLQSSQWRLWTNIEVRIPEDRIVIENDKNRSWDYVPSNWWEAAHAGELQFTAYYARLSQSLRPPGQSVSETEHSGSDPEGNVADSPSNIDRTPFSHIGHFDFQVCHSDLRPTEQPLSEQIPDLEVGADHQSTALQGMMYVRERASRGIPANRTLRAATSADWTVRVVLPHQNLYPDTTQPLFFQDNARVFLVTMPQGSQQANGKYRFDVFYHPYVCDFIANVNRKGVEKLLTVRSQALDDGMALTIAEPTSAASIRRIPLGCSFTIATARKSRSPGST